MPHAEDTIHGQAEKAFRFFSYNIWRREVRRSMRGRRDKRLRIVDVGCGPGFLLDCLETWFPEAELTGIDASDELLTIMKSRCRAATGFKGDACSLPLLTGSQDIAFALHVVEHLANPAQFFAEAYRVLRPGGLLILATPNADGLGARLMKRRWKGYRDPTHIALHGPCYWRQVATEAGYHVAREGTTGLSGIPILDRMPMGLIHWIPGFFYGYYPWRLGEAYVCIAVR
jgi:SAM-dependent methyltransferase